jgi:hypothetical protein
MPFKLTFDKREDAPEALRTLLTETDGKFVFEGETSTEIAALKTALHAERTSGGTTKSELDKLKKQIEGLDLDKAKQLLSDAEKLEAEKLKAKGDWETREANLKKQIEDQYAKQIDPLKTENERLKAAVEKHLKVAKATAAIAAAGGSSDLLLPHVLQQVTVIEENGEYVDRVIDGAKNVRIGDAKGTPMTVAQLVEEMGKNPVFAPAFRASGAGGSGAGPNGGGGGDSKKTMTRAAFDKLDPAEKMAFSTGGGKLTD